MSTSEEQIDVAAAWHTLERLRQLERELVEVEQVRRIDALESVNDAVRRIGDVGSPEGILERAAQELGTSSRFDRVLVSQVQEGLMLPHALWQSEPSRDDEAPLVTLRGSPIRLDYPLIETEVARRQAPAIVLVQASGPRTPPQLAEALDWQSYVVAALTLEGKTIGLLHADATNSGRAVDALDQEIASRYATGLASAFERVSLRQTLRRHREELRLAVRWINERLSGLTDPDLHHVEAKSSVDSDVEALTPRETEVLQLLVRGDTNLAIAKSLLVSEGTVKYHVKSILRKLNATSRADAVARYLRSAT